MIRFGVENFIWEEKRLDEALVPEKYVKKMLGKVIQIDGVFYYAKMVNGEKMINELIGSFLAKKIGLETVDYKVGLCQGEVYALSKILFEEKKIYMNWREFFKGQEKGILEEGKTSFWLSYNDFGLSNVKDKGIYKEFLKLIALDLKMGQRDRHQGNFFLCFDGEGQISLAKVFDYGNSYGRGNFFIYENPFVTIKNNGIGLREFGKKYTDIKEFIYKLEEIELRRILRKIEDEQGIIVDNELKAYYDSKDWEYNKKLRKIRKN